MRTLATFAALALSTLAHAGTPAAVRMLDADGDLVSVRAAAQDLLAVWEDDTLVVRVADSSVLQWTPINQVPDWVGSKGVTAPGFIVGLPCLRVFIGFEGLDRWDLVGDGEPADYDRERVVTGNTDITTWSTPIEGPLDGTVVELRTTAGYWQMGLDEADPRVFRSVDGLE